MCWYLTLAVPAGRSAEIVGWLDATSFGVEATGNSSAHTVAGKGFEPFLVTRGPCSCGLYRDPQIPIPDRQRNKRAKYERRGWSEAKIERALADSARASRPEEVNGPHPEVIALAAEAAKRAGTVRLWAHFFNGHVETETYAGGPVRRVPVARLPEAAPTLNPDEVLEISEGGPRGRKGVAR